MTRTPAQALAAADKMTTGYNGLCLKYVRDAYDIPARDATAAIAWEKAQHKHPGTDLSDAPAGAFVFMTKAGSPDGHVVLLEPNGQVRTTDTYVRHPHTVDLAYLTRAGYKVLGWSEDINGVRVAGLAPKKTPSKPATKPAASTTTLKLGSRGAKVKKLQQGLNATFPAYSKLKVDSLFGSATEGVVREFQERAGLTVDGIVGPKTTAALAKFGVTL